MSPGLKVFSKPAAVLVMTLRVVGLVDAISVAPVLGVCTSFGLGAAALDDVQRLGAGMHGDRVSGNPAPMMFEFSLAPLVWIGARSYGIYLWHLPVITLLTADLGAPVDGAWLAALQVLVTVTIAALSYRFVETPIHRRGFRAVMPLRASGRAVVGATAALAVAAIVVTVVLAPGPGAGVAVPMGVAPGIVVGDSSVADAANPLATAFGPGWTVHAAVGQTAARAARAIGPVSSAGSVVLSLGTDRLMTAADIRTLMSAVPLGVPVVIVLPVPRTDRDEVLAAAAPLARGGHATLVDWGATAAGRPALVTSAGALRPAGVAAYASVVRGTLGAIG